MSNPKTFDELADEIVQRIIESLEAAQRRRARLVDEVEGQTIAEVKPPRVPRVTRVEGKTV